MSTFRTPVGPQPSRVYWRRRLVVALGLVAVIVIIVLIIVRPGSGTPTAAPTATASTASPSAEPEPSPTASAVEGGPCDPTVVRVDALTDTNSYAPDQTPQLSFTITNTGTVSCTFNVGTTQQAFTITSGADVYWSSKDCETGAVDAPVLLEPGTPVPSTPIAWNRTRSAPDTCDGERESVPAGGATYSLGVTVGAVESASKVSFLLN